MIASTVPFDKRLPRKPRWAFDRRDDAEECPLRLQSSEAFGHKRPGALESGGPSVSGVVRQRGQSLHGWSTVKSAETKPPRERLVPPKQTNVDKLSKHCTKRGQTCPSRYGMETMEEKMGSSGKTTKFLAAAALATTLIPGSADALLKEGETAPNAKVEDADGKVLQMQSLKGKPILIVYEDRDSSKQNQSLKDDLAKLATGDKYKTQIALTAIADVSSYDWWPAKGFVKDAIREESKKQKTTIYCDWNGGFRKAYGIKKGVSNVLLVGRDGTVLFAAEGAMNADARKRLVSLLGQQVGG